MQYSSWSINNKSMYIPINAEFKYKWQILFF